MRSVCGRSRSPPRHCVHDAAFANRATLEVLWNPSPPLRKGHHMRSKRSGATVSRFTTARNAVTTSRPM
eukprot:9408394-Alexandrium_andersonii.AAC.1